MEATLMKSVETAAIRAVYELQYNSLAAAKFVKAEVPSISMEVASAAIQKVVKAPKKARAKK